MIAAHGLPLLFALLAWFVGTGAVFWLDRRGVSGRGRAGFALLTLAGGAAFYGLVASAGSAGSAAAYLGFSCALVIWGWHEFAFLTGRVTGPRRAACPEDATGFRRFRLAALTLIWHELALAATALALIALTWGAPNQTGPLTFLILFAMRLSTKLNIFAGVPHLADELMPARLEYMKSYFRKRAAGFGFVVSLGFAAGLATALGRAALGAGPAEVAGLTLLFGLVLLAFVEHLFLVMPWRDAALWRWANPSTDNKSARNSA